MRHVADGILTLNAHDHLREKRESQVAIARARAEAERAKRIAERIRIMNAVYAERLDGSRVRE